MHIYGFKNTASIFPEISFIQYFTIANNMTGESRSCVQTSLRSVCTYALGQDSPILTDVTKTENGE